METEEISTKTVGFRGRVSQSHWTEAVGANYCESETVESETGRVRDKGSQNYWEPRHWNNLIKLLINNIIKLY